MSHSSGIPVSDGLKTAFGNLVSQDNARLIKVKITNEELVSTDSKSKQGSFLDDLSQVPALLEAAEPCYILVKQDESTTFVMLCYVPPKSKVKDKMIYASSRSNLKQQLGSNYFSDEVFGDCAADFSVEGYQKHVLSKKTEAPLTESEQLKRNEAESGEIYSGGQSTYVHGVSFPVESNVVDAVKKLTSGSHNYVRIAIDCDAEKIILDKTATLSNLDAVRGEVSTEEPRFHFYSYKHNYEGASVSSIVYIYSCPDGSKGSKSAPVRMRMLYSSSKANVAEIIKTGSGTIDARLEINLGEEINEDELMGMIHPQKAEQKKTFAKPSRPGKGGARLVRN